MTNTSCVVQRPTSNIVIALATSHNIFLPTPVPRHHPSLLFNSRPLKSKSIMITLHSSLLSSVCRRQLALRAQNLTTRDAPSILGHRNLSGASAGAGGNTNKGSRVALTIVGGTILSTTAAIAYVNNHVGGGDGLLRTVSFYSLAIPKYIEYRFHMIMESVRNFTITVPC